MSGEHEEEERDFEGLFTVFEGSSPEDESHARQLWGSVSLQPPRESRLIRQDLRQRLPVARSSASRTSAGRGARAPEKPVRGGGGGRQERDDEAERMKRCESMAVRRAEIQGLLRSQRERRQQREVTGKPAVKSRGEPAGNPREPREAEAEREMVLQLES